jgi:DNA processing protein
MNQSPNENTIYFLALNRIPGIGPKITQKLLARWPDLAALFQLSKEELITAGLPEKLAHAISQFNLHDVDADLAWKQKDEKHHLLTWEHPSYPALLREIHDPPIALYAAGNLSCLESKTLGIVGTRHPSISGREIAKRFAYELALEKITLVSGLALGIDSEAHQGCLDADGQTIAVLGTGINRIYPYRHQHLAEKITEKGLVISEFPLGSAPTAGHFPRRNRIISGLSLAILVVEAAIKSGSLITARLALEQHRDVMAIPGSINNPKTQGCHHLLQQGARLVTSVADILDELGLDNLSSPPTESKLLLAIEEENLVNCLSFEITTANQIMAKSGLSFEEVACNLATLELKGVIKAVPGGYMRCGL